MLVSEGVFRVPCRPASPTLIALPSVKASAGRWQLAQLIVPSSDSSGSKNSSRPRAMPASVDGFSDGKRMDANGGSVTVVSSPQAVSSNANGIHHPFTLRQLQRKLIGQSIPDLPGNGLVAPVHGLLIGVGNRKGRPVGGQRLEHVGHDGHPPRYRHRR